MKRIPVLVAAWVAACTGAAPDDASQADVAITNATIIDVADGTRLLDQTILISGNRIVRVGASLSLTPPPAARVLDGSGKVVIPGLWDMHVHTVSHELDFLLHVANGVTGVRDMGGSNQYPPPGNWGIHFDSLRVWREAVRAGTIVGPRVIAAGVALDGPAPAWPQTLSIQTPDAAARVVDSLHRAGADFIKVYARLPREILLAIAAKATALGMPFAGHVSTFMNAEEVAAAGQRSIEHTNALDPSSLDVNMMRANITARPPSPLSPAERAGQIRRLLDTYDPRRLEHAASVLARSNTWTNPTLVTMRSLSLPLTTLRLDTARIAAYTPPYIRGVWSARLANVLPSEMFPVMADRLKLWEENIRALHRHGARFLVGSDAWNPNVVPGFGLHDELELLVAQGITPLEVLRAATLGAAEYLMLTDSIGSVSAGKVADLVLLDGDPLSDISNTRLLHAVVLNGRVLERRELDSLLTRARSFSASGGSR